MKQEWVKSWNASKQPRKQRKYRYNAPLHQLNKFLHVHLSKELRKKYGRRNLSIRTGDKVRIFVGTAKGKEGKVSSVDTKRCRIFIEGLERIKADGSKVFLPFEPSNLMITNLGKEDKRIKKTKKKEKNEE
jgi:large subunit ribosomal protein L24